MGFHEYREHFGTYAGFVGDVATCSRYVPSIGLSKNSVNALYFRPGITFDYACGKGVADEPNEALPVIIPPAAYIQGKTGDRILIRSRYPTAR